MGEFANKVRRNKIAGPNQKNYDQALWKTALTTASDEEDKRVITAGLFFDSLLSFIRSEKNFAELISKPEVVIRAVVAISVLNFKSVMQATEIERKPGEKAVLQVSSILEKKLTLGNGQKFHPDEILSGLGDGMKHILRELLSRTGDPSVPDGEELSVEQVNLIAAELNNATNYQCAVEYWHDCLSNKFGVEATEGGVAVTPKDVELEKARSISIYRRNKISMNDGLLFQRHWKTWPLALKKELMRIPLVEKVYGNEEISKIDVGFKNSTIENGAISVGAVEMIKAGCYGKLLREELPNFSNITLDIVIDGWRLLQSLALLMAKNLKPIRENNVGDFLRYAPTISKNVLTSMFAKSLNISQEKASHVLDVFVFGKGNSYDTWSQPLIPVGENFCLALPCIHSISLLRVVEGWMRRGGLDLDRRGKEFEAYCIDELDGHIKKSPIKNDVQLVKKSVNFHFKDNRSEEVDIVLVIADTLLVIEAKCILWPDDSLQFANYRDTVEKATVQISRKARAIGDNLGEALQQLGKMGCNVPLNPKIVPCVLTNSAVYSGFKFNGVAVVDLPILNAFFSNSHTKYGKLLGNKVVSTNKISFFEDAKNAGEVIESYLGAPPQLTDLKIDTIERRIEFPIRNESFGAIFHDIFSVEVDVDRMEKLYGNTSA
ncbi:MULTISPECIES: hypothetical protein [unclassified Duganella]|uniref:hypothetical protein n=1 Tax=unclassified Duganella TaxID=2636909 RepID=UPI0011C16EF2|nr:MULTISPECIES: hypothetical protein [unclassified Duganella]